MNDCQFLATDQPGVFVCAHCDRSTPPTRRYQKPPRRNCTSATADITDCQHRGPQIGAEPCRLCGRNGQVEPIYACAVHGECSLRRFKSGSKPACCLGCPDRLA